MTLGLLTGLLTGSCIIDTTADAQCTPDRNCVRDDGDVRCEVGYRWEDEADPDNFNCIADIPGDGGS